VANALLLNEPSRQIFVDLGYAAKAAERLAVGNIDDEFLLCRILFLLTYGTNIDFVVLVNEHTLAHSLNERTAHHSTAFSESGRTGSRASPMEDMAMVEALKLIFNITHFYPDLISSFTPSLKSLVNILLYIDLPSPPLQSPITYILNALLNLDLNSSQKTPADTKLGACPLFPDEHPEGVIERLTSILFRAIKEHPEHELDEAALPLCTLIRRVYEVASPEMKARTRELLLPGDQDREQPLGKGETLSARLLKLSCSPHLPSLGENISSLLFELSDKDPNKFVENIGYGFAAGYLSSHNIEIPASATGEGDTSRETANGGGDINPITGQRWSAESKQKQDLPEMTEEEKEREAERLFVLFERLRATGVVDVKNPVQQAKDEGRFEELD